MKEREIANRIATIKGLKMVHFYRLFGGEGPMCGILAYYGDQTINMCNGDTHFKELFERIALVYEREASANEILTDEETIRVLKQANAFRTEDFEKKLEGYTQVSVPILLPKAFCALYLVPIIRYVLESLYNGKDPASAEEKKDPIVFDTLPRQWFGKGILHAMRGEKHLQFPYQIFSMAGECYDIMVRNVLSDGNALKIEITFGYDRITVSYYDSYYQYQGNLFFVMKKQTGFVSHELHQKVSFSADGSDAGSEGETMFTVESECAAGSGIVPTERCQQLLGIGAGEWNVCELPWGERILSASVNGTEYRVLMTTESDLTISYVLCFRYLTGEGDAPLAFGEYSFRLYERSDITELHLLDLDPPGEGRYQERYAGRYYKAENTGTDRA